MAKHDADQRAGSGVEGGRGHLREIECVTVSILVFSKDKHLLMGQRDPAKKRGPLHLWQLPGGAVTDGETLKDAAVRKIEQELGLRLTPDQLTPVPFIGEDETVKKLDTGETVWCRMKLNRFEVRLGKTAAQLATKLQPGDDLVALRWFSPKELADVELNPGVREFFVRAGYIPAPGATRARL